MIHTVEIDLALRVHWSLCRALSIIARDSHADEHVVGYYNAGDRMKCHGSRVR